MKGEMEMIKKRLKRVFVVSVASTICLFGLLSAGVKAEAEEQSNRLIIDLVKLAPYAQWDNYYGEIKFGHYQEKTGCALYRCGTSRENWSHGRRFYEKEDKESGKDETRSIFTAAQHKSGYVRAKYPLCFPQSEKLLFESKVEGSSLYRTSTNVSVGYFLKGEGTKYLIKDKRGQKNIECNLTRLSGKRCEILLKAKGVSVAGLSTRWDNTQIIAFYPERGKPDLAISPSDIEVVPLSDGRVNIDVTIHNIAKTDAGKFHVDLYDGNTLLGKKEIVALKGGEKVSLSWQSLEISEGKHELIAAINSSTEENSKENNSAILICKFPVWGIMLKDIEGYPEPWKVEEVKVNITNNLADTAGYKLIYRLSDYWGEKIKSVEHNIPQNADFITLKPFADKKTGWWKMDASIVYKDKKIDSLSDTFCKVPMPPAKAQRGAMFGVFSALWPTPQMLKDAGASYSKVGWNYSSHDPKRGCDTDKRAISNIDEVIKTGQIPYVLVLQAFCLGPNDMGLTKMVEEAKKFGYKAASKYSHKKTGIWWYIMGEVNPKISPHDYAAVVRAFYEGAVKADPDVRIATMEMTHCWPSLLDSGKKEGTRYEWLAEMYPQARGCFHAVGNNFYSHLPPEEPFHNSIVKPCIDVIEKYGDLGKIEMHPQEGALPALSGIGTKPASMVRMYLYQLGLKERGASIISWYRIQDSYTPIARWGLLKFNRHPRPTYQAYAVMTQNLTGAKFIEKKDIGKDSYCYIFKKGRDTFTCIWKGKGKKEVIAVPARREVEITNLMGETTRIKPEKGEVKLTISLDPVYVRGLNLKRFKVISRHLYSKKVSFEDEYPDAGRLLTDKR